MDSKKVPPKPVPKPGQVKVVRSLYKYEAQQKDELSFDEGELLYIIDMSNSDWWKAKCGDLIGLVPSNYVQESMESMDFPLHDAAKRGNIQFVSECIANKVSANGLDKSGSTPLHWACRGGHLECVSLLLSQPNIQVNVQNKLGDTPLHHAAWKDHPEVVEMLLEKGAELDVKNIEKKTPFDLAKDPKTASLLQIETNHQNDYEDYQSDPDE